MGRKGSEKCLQCENSRFTWESRGIFEKTMFHHNTWKLINEDATLYPSPLSLEMLYAMWVAGLLTSEASCTGTMARRIMAVADTARTGTAPRRVDTVQRRRLQAAGAGGVGV